MSSQREPRPGDILPGGSVCGEKYARQGDWQIWQTQSGYALFVSAARADAWAEQGMAEPGIFLPYSEELRVAETDRFELISSSDFGPYPKTAGQTEALVKAFVQTRKLFPEARLAHALYLPQLPFLLTFGSGNDAEQDPWTLGRWTAGGMNIPFTDRNRMRTWAPWITEGLYADLMRLLHWEETDPQPIRPASPPEASVSAAVTGRREPRREGPFTLPGRAELERFFRERIIDVIEREEAYRRMGISFPGPTLLVGPPGCGKTYAVEKLTEYLGWPSYAVRAETIASSYLHETSRLISGLFRQAMENAPAVVIMDEMEAYLSSREGGGSYQQYHTEEMAEFLRVLPELPEKKVLLFGMTNMPDRIDEAIRRKGRFDHILKVEMPTEEELAVLMESLLKDIPKERGLDLGRIARKLEGRPISDAVYVVKEAGRLAVVGNKERIDDTLLRQAWEELENQGRERSFRRTIGFQ